ncbi:cold shock domain-containing protein [Hymenobacter sp. RP-2-7]|uniref:Cold shock domain-containing protein n=1 Tax=Hymenobacter polaris TaxID=2682546 RepID=A0A7Y0AHN5_9BACT|nr:cold shock domain-containing protein [Hymenobacter polaris]NML67536.1 cold shock domain-containing protein [Hymenobacter polaris]
MAKAQQNFSKQDNEKKRQQKKNEKEERRRERQASKGQSLDDMIAYVDENGNITSTPPDPTKKKEIALESIRIGVARQEDREEEDAVRQGAVTFFNTAKGYGFIKDSSNQESIFVHANNLGGLVLLEGDKVTFETEPGLKGPTAVRVKKLVA